jgi:translation elongation factor EF-G
MVLPLSQVLTDPLASSQEQSARALLRFVSRSDRIDAQTTEKGLVLLATSELELERVAERLRMVNPTLELGKPQINYIPGDPWLEPFAMLSLSVPAQAAAAVLADLQSRRGELKSKVETDGHAVIRADVPMAELFGYFTWLRRVTRSLGSFEQTFCGYRPFPKRNAPDA